MGYDDEMLRSRQRRSRARQSGSTSGGRTVDYKVGKEPGRKEPGLDLITDTFKERSGSGGQRTGGQENGGRRTAVRETSVRGSSRGRTSGRDAAGHGTIRRESAGSGITRRRAAAKARVESAVTAPEAGAKGRQKSDIYRNPSKRKKDKQKNKKRKIRIILLELVLLLGVLAFAGYSYVSSRLDLMTRLPWNPDDIKNPEISLEKQEQMEGYWTIAVFGVDSRNSSVGKGNNADVNILCNINQGTGEIKLVSVYRDTYLNITDKNSYNKINSAYLQGGPEQAVKALNKNLDLDIDDYATFNWKAVADAINILGGIDLEISDAEFYYINAFITETVRATGIGSTHLKRAGKNHLDGVQAVAYGRLRLMDSDYARTERQRKIISLAFEKAKKADWNTLNCIIQTVFPQVSTSVDMGDILSMGRNVTKYHLTETMGFPAARAEVNMGKKGACVIPQTLESNVTELHRFLFGDEAYVPTASVKEISQKIIADSGKAQEAKPIESVGTDGGVVPKTTEAAAETSEQEEISEEQETGPDGLPLETEKDGEPSDDGTSDVDTSDDETSDGEHAGNEEMEDEENGTSEDDRPGETDSAGNMILAPGSAEDETEGSVIRPGSMDDSSEEETEESITRPGGVSRPGNTNDLPVDETSESTSTGVILNPGSSNPSGEEPDRTSSGVEYSGPPGTA